MTDPAATAAERAAALILSAHSYGWEVNDGDCTLTISVYAAGITSSVTARTVGDTTDFEPTGLSLLLDHLEGELTQRAAHDVVITLAGDVWGDGDGWAWSATGGYPALYSRQADMMLPDSLCWWSSDDYVPHALTDQLSGVKSVLLSPRTIAEFARRGINIA